MQKLNKWLKKTKYIPVIILLVTAASVYAAKNINNEENNSPVEEQVEPVLVSTAVLDLNTNENDTISTVGTVKAEASVDIIALSGGTVRNLFFEVGDKVKQNQLLASLKNVQIATNLATANSGLSNALNSQEQARRIADETVKQAELGIQNALESVQSAEIGLKAAQDNLDNIGILNNKSTEDIKNNAKTTYYSFVNTSNSALNQIEYIIDAEDDGNQLPGIADTLSVKDAQYLNSTRNNYNSAKNKFDELKNIDPNNETIVNDMKQIINLLSLLKTAVDNTINALENTVSYSDLSESTLSLQKTNFTVLRASTVANLNSAELTLQGLENIGLAIEQDTDALENALKSAENQLVLANIGYQNSLVALESAKQGKEQQLIAAQSGVDSAKGQRNLVGSQAADLNLKTPIAGEITRKMVEIGTEVSPGQPVANVAQTDNVKIEISLASEDIYRVNIGQSVNLGKNLVGNISLIAPAADPITRKVKVEIFFNNENKKLIPGTFIDVSIPVEGLEKTHSESFFIPLKAVSITQTQNYVYISQENVAKKISVVTGKTEGALIEIIDGLNNGDILIIDGSKLLEDGNLIKTE